MLALLLRLRGRSNSRAEATLPLPERVHERAVRMVFEHQGEYPSHCKAIELISAKLGIQHVTHHGYCG